ncbi:hypothetical protein U6V44_07435 [Cutibacterium acnes]
MVAADLHGQRSPTGTEPSHGNVGARKATLFSGVRTRQDSTPGLVTGTHDLATKNPGPGEGGARQCCDRPRADKN